MNKRVLSGVLIGCYILNLQAERLKHAHLIQRYSPYKGIGYSIPGGLFLYDPSDETRPVIRVDNWRNTFVHDVPLSEKKVSDKWPDNSGIVVFRKPSQIV